MDSLSDFNPFDSDARYGDAVGAFLGEYFGGGNSTPPGTPVPAAPAPRPAAPAPSSAGGWSAFATSGGGMITALVVVGALVLALVWGRK